MPSHIFPTEQTLYIRSMGKALRVSAIFTDRDEANAYMAKHDEQALVACCGPFYLLADRFDKGTNIPRE